MAIPRSIGFLDCGHSAVPNAPCSPIFASDLNIVDAFSGSVQQEMGARGKRPQSHASQRNAVPLRLPQLGRVSFVEALAQNPGGTQAMQALQKIASSKAVKSLASLLLAGLVGGGVASAQAQRTGGPTPSRPGAEGYFIHPTDR